MVGRIISTISCEHLPVVQAKGRKAGLQWSYQGPPATSRMLEFVPGRDAVYPPQTLKRGALPG